MGGNYYFVDWRDWMTAEELIKLRDVDVTNVDRDTLVDLQDIRINDKLSVDERIASFIEQIKNPYCFKVDGVVVKVAFSSGGKSFNEQFEQMILGFS
jgi:hypothetical protein